MTEKEKALLGMEFLRGDPDLKVQRDRTEALCFQLNNTSPQDTEKRAELLQ